MTASRILVVEDDRRLAATLEGVLSAEGHHVEVVGDLVIIALPSAVIGLCSAVGCAPFLHARETRLDRSGGKIEQGKHAEYPKPHERHSDQGAQGDPQAAIPAPKPQGAPEPESCGGQREDARE